MSQLLGRIAKLSSSSIVKNGVCFRSQSTAATPYLLFSHTDTYEMTLSCEPIVELNLYDPRKDETVKIPKQTLTKDLHRSAEVGSSRGWVVARNFFYSTHHLTNMFNPSASASSRKVISLPPTEKLISRIALSASPDQEDCVVAALSGCHSLSLCRPGDSEWTRIRTPFAASGMIYSERDGKFYLSRVCHDEDYDGPIDLVDTSSSSFPQVSLFQGFPFSDTPESRDEQLSKGTDSHEHIVESPSGESFIVYWFDEDSTTEEFEAAFAKDTPYQSSSIRIKPTGFVVFKQDPEQRINSYTQDIGDLCIFLGQNEPFCVSATEYPGLKPNSIYFAESEMGFGFYDLSSNTLHDVINPPHCFCSDNWLAPLR